MVICRRYRCLGVMVRSAMVIHSMICDPGRKTTSRSFVAFERSSEVRSDQTRNRFKLLVKIGCEGTDHGGCD